MTAPGVAMGDSPPTDDPANPTRCPQPCYLPPTQHSTFNPAAFHQSRPSVYVWWAYSDGSVEDDHKDDHECIDMRRKEYRQIQGTNELYAFMAFDPEAPNIQGRFVMCFCEKCLAFDYSECYFACIAGAPWVADCAHKRTFNLTNTRSRQVERRSRRNANDQARSDELQRQAGENAEAAQMAAAGM